MNIKDIGIFPKKIPMIRIIIAANKIKGVRAALIHDSFSAHQGVEDDDMNLICLGGRVVGSKIAEELIAAFLNARYIGAERHRRRLDKIIALEK